MSHAKYTSFLLPLSSVVSTYRNNSEYIVSHISRQHFKQVNMKSKQSSSKKAFLPYLPQQSSFSNNWRDDIDMVVDISTSVPTIQDNVLLSHVQGMSTSTMRSNIESTAISYGDNQPVDPNLWDGSFSPISIFGVNESLSKNTKNIVHSLQRIRTYIKQYFVKSNSKRSIPLDFEPIILSIWQLINTVYESGWGQFFINDEQSISFAKNIIIQFTPKPKSINSEQIFGLTPKTLMPKPIQSPSVMLLSLAIPPSDNKVNFINKKAPKPFNVKKLYT